MLLNTLLSCVINYNMENVRRYGLHIYIILVMYTGGDWIRVDHWIKKLLEIHIFPKFTISAWLKLSYSVHPAYLFSWPVIQFQTIEICHTTFGISTNRITVHDHSYITQNVITLFMSFPLNNPLSLHTKMKISHIHTYTKRAHYIVQVPHLHTFNIYISPSIVPFHTIIEGLSQFAANGTQSSTFTLSYTLTMQIAMAKVLFSCNLHSFHIF